MIILVDQDGVIADCEAEFIKRIRRDFPNMPIIPEEERNTFYLEEQYTDLPEGVVYEWMYEEHFFRNLPLIEGAQEGVRRLMEDGHDVFICTTPVRSLYCTKEKIEWIHEHFPDLKKNIITTSDKTLVVGNILIDDKPEVTGLLTPRWVHVPYRSGQRNNGTFTWQNMDPLYELTKERDWVAEW